MVEPSTSTPLLVQQASRRYSDWEKKLPISVADEKTALTANTLHQVAHDIHEFGLLKERLNWFLLYIMAILLYMGLNGALLAANLKDQEFIEEHYELGFHLISFWGVFLFTVVEATLLISTEAVSWGNKGQSGVVLMDVGVSFFSATLFTLDPETFEVPAHYVEYLVQIPISYVNLIFVSKYGLIGSDENKTLRDRLVLRMEQGASYLVLALSLLQLFLYSDIIPTAMGGERAGHFCEFTTELLNGIFAFGYAVSAYNEWKEQLDQHHI